MIKQIITEVYVPLYPNVSPTVTYDDKGKLLEGPVIFKTDSGQGRLSATFENLEFKERMAAKGVYTAGPGLT